MKISVIIPVYNSENYLNDLLESLIHQKLKEIEIILVDDASTDCSLQILKDWQKKYPEIIRIFKNAKNMGQGFSRNLGLKYAQGEYISFIDSDDFIHPNMYYDMYNSALKKGFPDIITTGLVFAKENSSYLDYFDSYRRDGKIFDTRIEPLKILEQSPSCGNKLFKKEFIKNSAFLVGTMWEDIHFSYAHLFLANRVLVFNNPDYYYRKHINAGVSAQGFKVNSHILDIFKVTDGISDITQKSGRYNMFHNEIKLVQVIFCLQRIREILDWNINIQVKKELVKNMYHIIQFKYGKINCMNQDIISMRIDFLTLDYLKQLDEQIISLNEAQENIKRLLMISKNSK